MKYTCGSLDLDLNQGNFVASGGEGEVYVVGSVAYKIYKDRNRALSEKKILELSRIKHDKVIRPIDVVRDKSGVVGYSMTHVPKSYPLCSIVTKSFRDRWGISHQKMAGLVKSLRDIVQSVHDAGVLIVDLNEMNFLVNQSFTEVYAIDVDSYQTPNFPATAIMLSARDWSVTDQKWSVLSDWYSFAILSYTMFTGIHPYKGKHPTVHGLEERMKAGISVLDDDVSVPKAAVYPQDVIPDDYMDWYYTLFSNNKRVLPPSILRPVLKTTTIGGNKVLQIISPPRQQAPSMKGLVQEEIIRLPSEIVRFFQIGSRNVILTQDGVYDGFVRVRDYVPIAAAGRNKTGNPVIAWVDDNDVFHLWDVVLKQDVQSPVTTVDTVFGYDGRIYVKIKTQILEIDLSGSVISARPVAHVSQYSTRAFDGVLVQKSQGSTFVTIFPKPAMTYQVRIPELDDFTVVDARFMDSIVVAKVIKDGLHQDVWITFDSPTYTVHDIRVVPDGGSSTNFVITDKRVLTTLESSGNVTLSTVDRSRRVEYTDALVGDERLFKYGGQVAFLKDCAAHTLKMA